jgi:ligand-binding sensor domain-containing protein
VTAPDPLNFRTLVSPWRNGRYIRLVCAGWLLLSALAVRAQFRLDRWTTNEGLPQNSVTSLLQTREGYLWMTTNDGLVRFDGVRFTVFNRNNSPVLPANRLAGLFEDRSGRLWFHTEDGSVLFYEHGRFTQALKPGEIPLAPFSAFHHDGTGGVLFHSGGQNYRWQAGKIAPFHAPGIPAGSLIILSDRDGGFWFTDKGCVHQSKDGRVKTFQTAPPRKTTVYHAAYQDRQGSIWLYLSQYADEPLLRLKDERVQRYAFPGNNAWQFIEDLTGNLWFTVYNQGVHRIDAAAAAAPEPLPNATRQVIALTGISSNTSGQLCPDREGGMWVGTEQGLLRLLPQTIRHFTRQDGLPEENVYPLLEDHAGQIWAGIWQNSLVKYNGGRFTTVLQATETYFITTLFEDRQERLWFGALGKLYYLDNGQPVPCGAQVGFPQYTEFSVVAQDKDGALWFGTNYGLSRYANGKATVFTKQTGLPDNYVIALLPASGGKLWIGTRGTASATGTYNFTVQAVGAGNCGGTQTFSLAVSCPVVTLNPASLPNGTTGTAYSQSLSPMPAGNYSFSKTSGNLPPGLTLQSATGWLSGTPVTQGTYTFTVTATGFGTCPGSRSYTVTIGASCPAITLPSLPATGKVGVSYNGNLAATTPSGSYSFSLESGTLPPGLTINSLFGALLGKPTAAGVYNFTLKATRNNGCSGTRSYTIAISAALQAALRDFDGDGKSDLVQRDATGTWLITLSTTGATEPHSLGEGSDLPAWGDYDGDGRTDLAVYRAAEGLWLLRLSGTGAQLEQRFGAVGEPVAADYDGDGRCDLAVWDSANATWHVQQSSDGNLQSSAFGSAGDVAVPADYDGDGRADLAVFTPATALWRIQQSRDGTTREQAFGAAKDAPLAADFDGDGRADLGVWRAAEAALYLNPSRSPQPARLAVSLATTADGWLIGDYDGDGQAEIALWRAQAGRWVIPQRR